MSLLLMLNLPVLSRLSEDSESGLAFDLLRSPAEGPRVLTGHNNGIITLNVEEADDSRREQVRNEMGEPYRTLLGHLRHEVGHYYWDRLIRDTSNLEEFRTLFGDERQSYREALQRHYQQGPPADWQQRWVSAYSCAHPWEDWAESWAHYLHIVDTFDSALSFGLDPDSSIELPIESFPAGAPSSETSDDRLRFAHFIDSWTRLTAVLNELSRAMGLHDFYPFVLSRSAVEKIYFVHRVVDGFQRTARGSAAEAVHCTLPR